MSTNPFFKPTTTTGPLEIPFMSDPRIAAMARGLDFAIAAGDSCLHQAIALANKDEPITLTARGEWLGQPVEQKWVYRAFRNEAENKVLFVMVEGTPDLDDPMCFRRIYPARKESWVREGPKVEG